MFDYQQPDAKGHFGKYGGSFASETLIENLSALISEIAKAKPSGAKGQYIRGASLASTIKRDLSGMGKALFIGMILLLVAAFANIFLQMPALMIAISVIAIGIFSAFLLYDLNRVITGGETNYISATLAVYLSLYNIFSNLLALLGIFGGDRD